MPTERDSGRATEGQARLHRSAAVGFQAASDAYRQARPSYHPEVAATIAERFADGLVVELGAGTGIFTAQLVAAGASVLAVEPVPAMRRAIADGDPGATVVDGTAERIPVDDGAAATVVAAQAFHWFDHGPAIDEIARVLRPGGHLVTVWNVRDYSVSWVEACTEITDRHAGDTPRHRTMQWRRAIDGDARFTAEADLQFDNPWPSSPELVVARTRSTSFVAALDEPTRDAVLAEILAVVGPLGPSFDYPYISELQAWRLS